jgi:hypothetical protein
VYPFRTITATNRHGYDRAHLIADCVADAPACRLGAVSAPAEHAFPRSAGELSREWLEARLRARGVLQSGHVGEIHVAPVGEPGLSSEVVRVTLAAEGAIGVPVSLIAKFASAVAETRGAMHALGQYGYEVSFYRELGGAAGIPLPACYVAEIDRDSGEFVLLLEDLGASRNGDWWQSQVADVETALDHLAAFHASWWNSPRLLATPWLRKPTDASLGTTLGGLYRALLPIALARYPQQLNGYLADTACRLADRVETFCVPRAGAPLTLCHGDFHPKQLFFPSVSGGRFAVFDWQTVSYSPPSVDVQRILLMGLRPPELFAHQARLLERYRARLADAGIAYDQAQLAHDVRRSMLWTLFTLVIAAATMDRTQTDRAAAAAGVDADQRFYADMAISLEHNRVHELL